MMNWFNNIRYNWRYYLTCPIRYAVITSVPDTRESNYYDEVITPYESPILVIYREGSVIDVSGWTLAHFRRPVFEVGEILIVNRTRREVGYPGRKPDKWDVGCEHFILPWRAIKRAKEVLKKEKG